MADIPGITSSICMHQILIKDGEKAARHPQRWLNPFILDVVKTETYITPEDKENTTFTCPLNTFTLRKILFDIGIKSECTDKNFKVNGHLLKLFHESPILEEETAEELSLGNTTYSIIYPP